MSVCERDRAEGKSIHSCDCPSSVRSGEGVMMVEMCSGSCAVVGRDMGANVGW